MPKHLISQSIQGQRPYEHGLYFVISQSIARNVDFICIRSDALGSQAHDQSYQSVFVPMQPFYSFDLMTANLSLQPFDYFLLDSLLWRGFLISQASIAKKHLRTTIGTTYDNPHLLHWVIIMETLSYSVFRKHLADVLDKVNDDHKPVMITRQNGKPAIVMSVEDFQYYEETAYLMASPKNAERLNQAIAEVEAGQTVKKGLIK